MWAIGRFQLWGCLWQSWCHRNTFTIYLTDIEKPRCSQFIQNLPLSLTFASIPCKTGTPTPRGRRAKRSERGLYWNWSLRLSYYPKRLKESLQEGSYKSCNLSTWCLDPSCPSTAAALGQEHLLSPFADRATARGCVRVSLPVCVQKKILCWCKKKFILHLGEQDLCYCILPVLSNVWVVCHVNTVANIGYYLVRLWIQHRSRTGERGKKLNAFGSGWRLNAHPSDKWHDILLSLLCL